MPGRIHLYVSASPDMEAEREYVARAVARFPVPLGWELSYTPSPDRAGPPDPGPIESSDLHIILLGRDIHAPVGWELWVSRSAGNAPLGFARETGRTPAGEVFYKQARLAWTPFESPDQLLRLVQRALARQIIEDPTRYDLSPSEWQTLNAFLEERKGEMPARDADMARVDEASAGHGAVLFSPTHYEPSQGVLIKGPKAPPRRDEEE